MRGLVGRAARCGCVVVAAATTTASGRAAAVPAHNVEVRVDVLLYVLVAMAAYWPVTHDVTSTAVTAGLSLYVIDTRMVVVWP